MSENNDFAEMLAPMFGLAGKVALVTGGAVGMGKAAGLALAGAGATVILADDAERVAALGDLPDGVSGMPLDVTDEAAVNALAADITARHGGIDILVNGAVFNHNKPLLQITAEEWDRVQAVNLKSAFLVTRAVIPAMQRHWRRGLAGGAMQLISYGIAIWAMTQAPIALVAALRETSVLFGVLLAALLLKEPLRPARLAAALLIVTGLALVRLQ